MEEKIIAPITDLEEFVFQIERELPTGRVIHDEIGVSWEIIAAGVYFCSRNEVKKYADFLPKVFYTANQEEAAQEVLSVWEKAFAEYRESIVNQDGRVSEAEKKWKQERPKYERALKFSAQFTRLSEAELCYIRGRTGEADYTPGYDGEYDILDVAYDETAHSNRKILLGRMEPVLKKLPIEQTRKLASFYGGYAALAYIPLVAHISIMTEDARQELKGRIDSMTANVRDQLQRAACHAKELADCHGIRQGDSIKLRGGWQTVWHTFEEKTNGAWYLHVLRIAALVLTFPVWEMADSELEALMEYAFFLDNAQQREILNRAKELLAAGEMQSPHKLEEIQPFVSGTAGEQEVLEQYFDLEIASAIYDM